MGQVSADGSDACLGPGGKWTVADNVFAKLRSLASRNALKTKRNVMFFKSRKPETEPKPEAKAVAKPPAKEQAAPTKPSPEQLAEVQKRAAKSKQLQASFGGIVGLMMRHPEFRKCTLADLEHLMLPAFVNGQFTIAEAQAKRLG